MCFPFLTTESMALWFITCFSKEHWGPPSQLSFIECVKSDPGAQKVWNVDKICPFPIVPSESFLTQDATVLLYLSSPAILLFINNPIPFFYLVPFSWNAHMNLLKVVLQVHSQIPPPPVSYCPSEFTQHLHISLHPHFPTFLSSKVIGVLLFPIYREQGKEGGANSLSIASLQQR